jgi:hypothetical protein
MQSQDNTDKIIIKFITYTAASKRAQTKYLSNPENHKRVNENKNYI